MSKDDDYTTGNILDLLHHQNYYKLTGMGLSRQTNTSIPQQINFVGISEKDGVTKFVITEKQQETILNFSLDSLILKE